MNSRERILTALDHREPDRVPFDLGSCQVTGIHATAYQKLRIALGLPQAEINMCDAVQQLAAIGDDVATRMNIDTRGLYPLNSHNWQVVEQDAGENWAYRDEWGITHHRPKENGLYFSVVKVPLPQSDITLADIANHPWPDVGNPERIAGLRELALSYRNSGYAVVLKDAFAGIFEFAQRIVGMENLLMMMITDEKAACALFDKLLELKQDYWQTALAELGDLVDIVTYADDYGTQESQLISPDMFRRLLKSRVKTLFDTFINRNTVGISA